MNPSPLVVQQSSSPPLRGGGGTRSRALRIVVPCALAALELTHPTWSEGSVSGAVGAAGGWWLPLHLLLIAGYLALVRVLWGPGVLVHAVLVAFLVCNTAFLAIDGVAGGLLAGSDPDAVDALWNSQLVTILANLTGATWAASLLSIAAAHLHGAQTRIGPVLTWVAFVVSAPPLSAPPVISRLLAAATGAWIVYARGTAGLPVALLAFAAVLHQHVGAEAAFGLLLVAAALARLPEPG
jgi:hypothetical protein